MARYIKKFRRVGLSLGPSEERGFELWVGYDIEGHHEDLSHLDLVRIDDETLVERYAITAFTRVGLEDTELRRKLGLGDQLPNRRSQKRPNSDTPSANTDSSHNSDSTKNPSPAKSKK